MSQQLTRLRQPRLRSRNSPQVYRGFLPLFIVVDDAENCNPGLKLGRECSSTAGPIMRELSRYERTLTACELIGGSQLSLSMSRGMEIPRRSQGGAPKKSKSIMAQVIEFYIPASCKTKSALGASGTTWKDVGLSIRLERVSVGRRCFC